DIMRPAIRPEIERIADRAAIFEAHAPREARDIGYLAGPPGGEERLQHHRWFVHAAVIVGEARIQPETGRQLRAARHGGGPDVAIADIRRAGEAGAVDEIRLDVAPAGEGHIGRQLEGIEARLAVAPAEFE